MFSFTGIPIRLKRKGTGKRGLLNNPADRPMMLPALQRNIKHRMQM